MKTKLYYLRNRGFIGNSWIWWKKGGGYTANLNLAQKFTEKELKKYSLRQEDMAYKVEEIDAKAERHFTGLDCEPVKVAFY